MLIGLFVGHKVSFPCRKKAKLVQIRHSVENSWIEQKTDTGWGIDGGMVCGERR
jgi:hypothetical protein